MPGIHLNRRPWCQHRVASFHLPNKKLILCLGDHTKHLALLELCPEEAFESNSRFAQEIVSKAQVCSPQPESQFSHL